MSIFKYGPGKINFVSIENHETILQNYDRELEKEIEKTVKTTNIYEVWQISS